MYYQVTIGYENESEGRNGETRTKTQKVKYVFQGESVEEVTIIANKYLAEDSRTAELISVINMNIECVIDKANDPKYY